MCATATVLSRVDSGLNTFIYVLVNLIELFALLLDTVISDNPVCMFLSIVFFIPQCFIGLSIK